MGLRFAAGEDLPKQWSMRNRTSRWLRTSKSVGPTTHLSAIGTTANILSATRLPQLIASFKETGVPERPLVLRPSLTTGLPFSRMMTLAGPLTRNFASAHVGQASHLTFDEICQAKSLTYGAEEEFHAARDLAIACLGANVITRHASTPQTYVNSLRSQTTDLRQFGKIPCVWNSARRGRKNRYERALHRYER
jgi:hypothetical protein